MRLEDPFLFGAALDDIEIQAIQLLPHARTALLAHMPKIFAAEAMQETMEEELDRLKTRVLRSRVGSTGPAASGARSASKRKSPASRAEFRRLVQPELQLDVDEPRGVFGAFEVTAHPVEAVGDARKHACIALESLHIVIAWRTHALAPGAVLAEPMIAWPMKERLAPWTPLRAVPRRSCCREAPRCLCCRLLARS